MRYEIFTLGKHYLQVHTSKGFTLFANAKLNPNGEVVSYSDKLERRGGSWVIDTWKFLTVKYFPENPIYCAVFGFEDDDTEVRVSATDIDVDSISGVNGQLVDIGNISLAPNQSLRVSPYAGIDNEIVRFSYIRDNSGHLVPDEDTANRLLELFPLDTPSIGIKSIYGCIYGSQFTLDGRNGTDFKFVIDIGTQGGATAFNVCAFFVPSSMLTSRPFYFRSLNSIQIPDSYSTWLEYENFKDKMFADMYYKGKLYTLLF